MVPLAKSYTKWWVKVKEDTERMFQAELSRGDEKAKETTVCQQNEKKKGFIGLTIIFYKKYLFSFKGLKPKVILGADPSVKLVLLCWLE